jgi:large subunit ribosomal protein L47
LCLGREWTVSELRPREWEVLHKLWWVCVKERNRLATEKITRQRVQAGYGDLENNERDKVIQKSMKAVIDVLVERNNAYNEAYQLAQTDPEIDLNRLANQYQPPSSELPYDAEVRKFQARSLNVTNGSRKSTTRQR